MKINRPEPITADLEVFVYTRNVEAQYAIDALVDGDYVLIGDSYSSGLHLLDALKQYVKTKHAKSSFQGQRDFRGAFYELSNNILVEIEGHRIALKKSPEIGWLKKLYPEISSFVLPFPKVQGLNSAWQWYIKGIFIPSLKSKIYPYFGTYFPTRFEHIDLFDNWLSTYTGEKKSAIDIGVGSGVLSMQLLKHGFESVIGTDINPNAIFGLSKAKEKNKQLENLELIHGNLFESISISTELIVFNPPWLPTKIDAKGIDLAIYYDEELFPSFFKEAVKHLNSNGLIVLIFSNLAQVTGITTINPIEKELKEGGRFKKEIHLKKAVKAASTKTKRDQNWRQEEEIELWVLSCK